MPYAVAAPGSLGTRHRPKMNILRVAQVLSGARRDSTVPSAELPCVRMVYLPVLSRSGARDEVQRHAGKSAHMRGSRVILVTLETSLLQQPEVGTAGDRSGISRPALLRGLICGQLNSHRPPAGSR
jgi:hypothetical protein